jgi:hypothetical protein
MSNITISSTTSSQEEMEHAASPNWREPFTHKAVAPETEVETPVTQETELETAAASDPAEKQQESKPKSRAQRAIDKLTARNHRLEEEAAELRKKVAPAEEKTAPAQTGPPKLQDFLSAGKTADDWADARDAWKADQEAKQAVAERQKATFDAYNKGVSEARGRYEDWDDVVSAANSTIPEAASLAVIECDNGADVAYYLAKHPEICEELMDMTPVGAIRRIGKISDSLNPESKAEKKNSPSEKPRPKPAEPITPVGGSTTQSATPLDKLPIKEYMKVRDKQERERRH